MAMTRELGRLDLFVTYTANPNWPEIKEYLQTMPKGTSTSDIAYFVVRAFNIRLSAFISEITSGKVFGPIIGYIYTIEFQKRGLPHAHCIFILNHENKLLTPDKIDRFISAEIPDKDEQPNLHEKVMKHMLHGPHSENTPCWNPEKSSCSKKFPFNFRNETDMTCDGFPKYKRNDNRHELNVYNKKINGKRVFVDNSMVVPYNPYLILKYDCHINVEYCGSLMAIKYMFKYLTKGHDRIKVSISGNDNNRNIDEISDYIDTRYLSSMEAAWRLQQIPMHGHSHSVMRLPVHLPGQQYVTFKEGSELQAISEKNQVTKLTAYFELNQTDINARNLFYHDIPKYYVWKAEEKKWKKRIRQTKLVVRLYSISPKDCERFYLKILLRKVKGALNFSHLKTVNNIELETFREAAYAKGYGMNKEDVDEIMNEAVSVMMPSGLRSFFVYLLLTSENINGKRLWEKFKNYLYEDSNESNAISEIEQKLNGEEKSLKDFGINIDKISQNYFDDGIDNTDHGRIAHGMIDNLNEEQREIFTEISKSIMKTDNTNRFFIDGPGGTGKTFLYRALYHHLKHNNKKVLCIAWTGIAAILLPGGKTAHRVFKLPLQMTSENDIKPAKLTTALKQILTEVDFIIWDEASMILSTAFQIVNVTLQDLMRNNDPFGGKAVCLGGDFRQLLPVVKKGSRNQIVKSALISSPLWKHFKIFHLKKNMRANNEEFSEWLLQIGNGKKEIVEFPSEMICNENIVDSIFKEYNEETLKTSILLASRNCEVDRLNEEVLSKMEGETIVSEGFSWATAVDGDLTDQDELTLRYQPEYLASLNPSGMPSQNLKLKEGAVVQAPQLQKG
ncbi:unnamed protein product [Bemisia tabaci]|uniref:ATP-dependent DNA helicase n=1 Tax=Bemisia tabaci TaxID=7038 RepID=A0A9P0A658_BEMTA|nr:unnamed protein product [Bemisia tabaci]